jgi:glycosyltransferase involved in cell wall biosynthesis
VQLSSIESWCYSIREALANNVAVIGSKIPEIKKVIKDGVNGYLLDDDLGNLDVDKIFNKIPKPKGYSEPMSDIWRDVMEGKL